MAKVQGKKSAASKKATAKPAARAKSARSAKPAPKPKRPAKAVKAAAKAKAPVQKSAKKKAMKKAASKPVPNPKVTKKGASPAKATKPTKAVAKSVAAPAAKTAKAEKAKAAAARTVVKAAPGAAAATATATVARVAPKAAAEPEKKRRRSRPRVSSSGPATASWFSQGENKPRPSSFIAAPPRAEAPSLVAAPPASSDRLVSNDELTAFAVRTAPVRIDVEAMGGRILLHIFPEDVVLRAGEGIEWDFRYLSGADVLIEEMIIELDKPAPFSHTSHRSKRPGINRPHRQLSGPVLKSAAGKQFRYTVKALNVFKTEMATARPSVTVT
jgi:hypothetical protein